MKLFIKVIAVILLSAMILNVIACNSSTSADKNDNKKAGSDDSTIPAETDPPWLDSLPDNLNYNGATLTYASMEPLFVIPEIEETADIVNAAKYETLVNVEERLNLKVQYTEIGIVEMLSQVGQLVKAGDDSYDFIAGQIKYIANAAILRYVYNLKNLLYYDYLNLDAEYWSKDFIEGLNYKNAVYWLCGASGFGLLTHVYCSYVNLSLWDRLNIDGSVFDLVRQGQWTIDKTMELSKTVYGDINGDGKAGEEDRYGFIYNEGRFIEYFPIGLGARYSAFDEDGIPYATINNETMVKISDKINEFVETVGTYPMGGGNSMQTFPDGLCLITVECLDQCGGETLRSMEDDFAAIPLPKLDENQENYLTSLEYTTSILGIPITTTDEAKLEMALAFFEASSAETYRLFHPVYLDDALKNKYTRDENSAEMIDLLLKHVVTDFAFTYADYTMVSGFFAQSFKGSKIASKIAAKEESLNKQLLKMVSILEKNA